MPEKRTWLQYHKAKVSIILQQFMQSLLLSFLCKALEAYKKVQAKLQYTNAIMLHNDFKWLKHLFEIYNRQLWS